MARDLQCRVLPAATLSAHDIAAWEKLSRTNPDCSSPFLSPHYTRAVAACRPFVYVAVILEDRRPCGFLPFQFRNAFYKLLGAAERVGGEMTDYFGLIARPGLTLGAPVLLQLTGLNHLYFTHLDESQLSHGLEGGNPEPGLRIRLRPAGLPYQEDLRRRDRKLFEDTQRRRRRVEQDYGPLRFCFDESEVGPSLDRLIRWKRLQYRRTGAPDALAAAWTRRLLRLLAESRRPDCWGVLSSLYAGDTWVGSHLGLYSRSALHYWFPVYNPELGRYAPGRLLLLGVIEAAEGAGLALVDRGAGDPPAKRELANDRHLYYRGAWYRPSFGAMISRCHYSLLWKWNDHRLSAS